MATAVNRTVRRRRPVRSTNTGADRGNGSGIGYSEIDQGLWRQDVAHPQGGGDVRVTELAPQGPDVDVDDVGAGRES
jgi:hypothetical protein